LTVDSEKKSVLQYSTIVKSKKKVKKFKVDLKSSLIREEWLKSNESNPCASRHQKKVLAFQTNLTTKQITSWLYHNRKKSKSKKEKINRNRLSTKQKIFLVNYFKNVSKRPIEEEITKISQTTGIKEKKIICWFASERFKNKKNE
ncbi:unnamed protein product, partial [Brachionus calyciflorus]